MLLADANDGDLVGLGNFILERGHRELLSMDESSSVPVRHELAPNFRVRDARCGGSSVELRLCSGEKLSQLDGWLGVPLKDGYEMRGQIWTCTARLREQQYDVPQSDSAVWLERRVVEYPSAALAT